MSSNDRIILIDADVVSHFIVGGQIINLPHIFDYKIKILDKVYKELEKFPRKQTEVDNLIRFKLLQIIDFPEENFEIKKEYAYIKNKLFKGDGESACMAVARYTQNILASSNLRDVHNYCTMHKIPLLSTMDFLCEGLRKGIFDLADCNDFIQRVLKNNSRLPVSKMQDHNCRPLNI